MSCVEEPQQEQEEQERPKPFGGRRVTYGLVWSTLSKAIACVEGLPDWAKPVESMDGISYKTGSRVFSKRGREAMVAALLPGRSVAVLTTPYGKPSGGVVLEFWGMHSMVLDTGSREGICR